MEETSEPLLGKNPLSEPVSGLSERLVVCQPLELLLPLGLLPDDVWDCEGRLA